MEENLVKHKLAQYLLLKADIQSAQAEQARIKAELEPLLQASETNTRGSRVLAFSTPLEIDGVRYKELQKTRKESKVLNEERVKNWLRAKVDSESEEDIYWDDLVSNSDIFITVTHINQDTLWDWFVEGYITDEELSSFFDINETWAFNPTKE